MLLKIRWQDKISDTEVLKRAGRQSMHTLLKLARLRWTGHVTRMPDERLLKKVFYRELQVGKRSQGGQKKRHKDILKASLKDFNIPPYVLGTDCTGSINVALPHQKGSKWLGSNENQRSRKKAQRAQSQSHHEGPSSESSISAIISEHHQSRHSQSSSGNIIRAVTFSHHQGTSSESSLSAIIRELHQSRHSQPSSGNIVRVVTLSQHQGTSSESSLSVIIRELHQSRHSKPSSGNIIRVVTLSHHQGTSSESSL